MVKVLVFLGGFLVASITHAETFCYFGTYTKGESKGIYRSTMDAESGHLSKPELAAELASPSFVAVHPGGGFLYAVSEISDLGGKKTGGVSAFSIGDEGELALLNQRESGGAGPCHVSLDPDGKVVLVANYEGGSVASFPVKKDGSLGMVGSFIQHEGSSVNPKRQAGPHAHSINTDPKGARVFCADLGLDKVLIYELDRKAGTLAANDPAFVELPGGTGPRHFSFHPRGKFAFTCLEMTREVAALSYDATTGAMEVIEIESTVGADVEEGSTAETLVHSNGKWVYVSNRGDNSIAAFAIDQETGELGFIETEPTQGEIPRNFGLDPSGTFLVAANQKSGNVAVLRIDPKTGALSPTGQGVEVPNPVCVRFVVR